MGDQIGLSVIRMHPGFRVFGHVCGHVGWREGWGWGVWGLRVDREFGLTRINKFPFCM